MFVAVLFGSTDCPEVLKTFITLFTVSTTKPLPAQRPWSGGSTENWFPPRE
jgi:hypothetical protein